MAVITGGGGVLCRSMTLELTSRGAKITVLDLREDRAHSVVDEIRRTGGISIPAHCDVLDNTGLETACKNILGVSGMIDILIK